MGHDLDATDVVVAKVDEDEGEEADMGNVPQNQGVVIAVYLTNALRSMSDWTSHSWMSLHTSAI